jgi:hypothetical protein
MTKQLNFRNDKAHDSSRRLATHLNTSAAVAETALRQHVGSVLSEVHAEEAAETCRILTELGREIAKHVRPGAGSDHGDFYDHKGLPV